jgi:hypothetical protein
MVLLTPSDLTDETSTVGLVYPTRLVSAERLDNLTDLSRWEETPWPTARRWAFPLEPLNTLKAAEATEDHPVSVISAFQRLQRFPSSPSPTPTPPAIRHFPQICRRQLP